MKASPGLNYVTGPMGAGKTLFAVRQILGAIMHGKYAITNVELRDGWATRCAKHNPQIMLSRWLNKLPFERCGTKYRKTIAYYESLYIYETSLERAMKYRVPGKKEGRAIFVWDEAHNDLNNRDWNSTRAVGKGVNQATGRTQLITEKDVRSLILKWATQLRKLGFVGFLVSQHGDNTDAALRRICNTEIRLLNQRENVRLLGMRICPIPFFLAMYYPTNTPRIDRSVKWIGIERYFLSWHKKCYDTLGLFHNIQEHIEGTDAVWLPHAGQFTPEARAQLVESVGEAAHAEPDAPAATAVAQSPDTPGAARVSTRRSGGRNLRPSNVRLVSPINQPEGRA